MPYLLKPATILIVDDERPIGELLVSVFQDYGHRARHVLHGRQALDVVAQERPHLVLSDVMMPIMNGVDLCRKLKSSAETQGIRVILMTAARASMALQAPADAVISKPFDLESLTFMVWRWLPPGFMERRGQPRH